LFFIQDDSGACLIRLWRGMPRKAFEVGQRVDLTGNVAVRGVLPETMKLLMQYRWPGNVRELENAIERAVSLGHGPFLTPDDLPAHVRRPEYLSKETAEAIGPGDEGCLSLEEVEKRHLVRVLKETKRNKVRAAKILGIDRRTLYRMAERFGLDLGDDADSGEIE